MDCNRNKDRYHERKHFTVRGCDKELTDGDRGDRDSQEGYGEREEEVVQRRQRLRLRGTYHGIIMLMVGVFRFTMALPMVQVLYYTWYWTW